MWKRYSIAALTLIVVALCVSCSDKGSPTSPPPAAPAVAMWQKVIGGETSQYAISVATVPGDGYVAVGGVTSPVNGSTDILVLKVDAAGETVWQKVLGGVENDYAWSVVIHASGNIAIAGSTASYGAVGTDALLMCLDPDGNLLWQKTYGGDKWERMESLISTADGGFAMAGWTSSFDAPGGSQAWLIKTDALGNVEWDRKFGGGNEDDFSSVRQLHDGSYVMAGSTNSMGVGFSDVYVVKADASGDPIWQRAFGGSGNEFGRSVIATPTGYVVAGWVGSPTIDSHHGAYDIYVLKVDFEGDLLWENCYGGAGYDGCEDIAASADGGFVVAGHIQDMISGGTTGYLFKINALGTPLWDATLGNTSDATRSVKTTIDGGVITAGLAQNGAGSYDVYLVKTNSAGQTAELSE